MAVREETIEKYLIRRIKEAGGACDKWVCPGRRAVPDRICFVPGYPPLFLEVKRSGKKPTAAQHREGARLLALDQRWTWVNSKESVDTVLRRYFNLLPEGKTVNDLLIEDLRKTR